MIDLTLRNPKLLSLIYPAGNTNSSPDYSDRTRIIREPPLEIEVYIWQTEKRIDIRTNAVMYVCHEDIVCELATKLSDSPDLAYKMIVRLGLTRLMAHHVYKIP